jgi:hypothetical protein
MKFYITKYALSTGITVVDAQPRSDPDLPRVRAYDGRMFYYEDEAFANWPSALDDAECRRAVRIASLRKQIIKVQGMIFVEPT